MKRPLLIFQFATDYGSIKVANYHLTLSTFQHVAIEVLVEIEETAKTRPSGSRDKSDDQPHPHE